MDNSNIHEIKERNKRVETDKAWETSMTRKISIAVITYGIAALFMKAMGFDNPFVGAIVPTGGYLLSTISLPILKNFWLKNIYRKQES